MKRSSVESILDAIYESILAVGIKRTTFAEVARRAGVSRATLYTHFDDVDSAVAELLTRELGRVLVQVRAAAAAGSDGRARLLTTVEHLLQVLPAHPLLTRALEVDPELLLPYVTERLGAVQRRALAVALELVVAGQEDGSIAPGDPRAMAYTIMTTVQSFVVSHRITAGEQEPAVVRRELLAMLERGLRP